MRITLFAFLLTLLLSLDANAQTTQTATWALSWQANNTTQTGFNVERSGTQTGTFTKIGSTAATVTTYNDVATGDPGGTQHCYRLAAFNAAGQGPYSTVQCATSPTVTVPPPNAPLGVSVAVTVVVTTQSPAPTKAKK